MAMIQYAICNNRYTLLMRLSYQRFIVFPSTEVFIDFLVTGGVNKQNLPIVRQIYEQMPKPNVVIAVGTCACSGGVFRECYNMLGGMDKAIPVDVYVPGCAARPESIIDGVVKGLGVLEEKAKALKEKKQ